MALRKSSLSKSKQIKLLEYFVLGAMARASAELVSVQINTATKFFMRLRYLIAYNLPTFELYHEVEADESYFWWQKKMYYFNTTEEKLSGPEPKCLGALNIYRNKSFMLQNEIRSMQFASFVDSLNSFLCNAIYEYTLASKAAGVTTS